MRVAVSLTGHWLVGHFAHRPQGKGWGDQGWRVEGVAVQGFNIRYCCVGWSGSAWSAN
jgi:hypothetical protein